MNLSDQIKADEVNANATWNTICVDRAWLDTKGYLILPKAICKATFKTKEVVLDYDIENNQLGIRPGPAQEEEKSRIWIGELTSNGRLKLPTKLLKTMSLAEHCFDEEYHLKHTKHLDDDAVYIDFSGH